MTFDYMYALVGIKWDTDIYVAVSVGLSAGSKSSGSSHGKHPDSFGSSSSANGLVGSMNFSLKDILEATNNFSRENLIGQGGFGTVYRGRLKDGSLIAVKRAKSVRTCLFVCTD